ncbi:transcriptional regulator NrdR [Candidatus Cerribacteria bacterium 'Amazon FNV 2010 28 9']|uniref:Transcriptional repressor NrdR n=1 Tax=Candidatus Cerribacteria bacterium 'Amazon FNV 2010 28 9' TaxID=2081795 RepID=A0A317JQD9_9BACT|nr:MAG: transcriptional regulator NrdR [Candidatus Cerribacteria bacterium 'Amazon FNV 2010 28 9']
MKCPYCHHTSSSVLESRLGEDRTSIRRRRQCERCHKRFTTYERTEGIDLTVIKKDGRKECFSREKLKRGILKATWKRPVSLSDIEGLIDEVEEKLRQRGTTQMKSWEIGKLVVNRLRKLDPLSYLLYASVYRDFRTLEDFEKELAELKTNGEEKSLDG